MKRAGEISVANERRQKKGFAGDDKTGLLADRQKREQENRHIRIHI